MGRFRMAYARETENDFREQGKKRYEEGDIQKKLEIIEKQGHLDTSCPTLYQFNKAIEEKKPLAFYHCSTTGLREDDEITVVSLQTAHYSEEIGEYVIDKDYTVPVRPKNYSVVLRAIDTYNSDFAIHKRFEQLVKKTQEEKDLPYEETVKFLKRQGFKDAKPYDVFENAGISYDEYRNVAIEPAEACEIINDLMADEKGAVLVGFNSTTFTDKFFNRMGDMKFLSENQKIDLRDLVMEYDYQCLQDDAPVLNENEGRYTIDNLGEQVNVFAYKVKAETNTSTMLALVNEIGNREKVLIKNEVTLGKAVLYQQYKAGELVAKYGEAKNVPIGLLSEIGVSISDNSELVYQNLPKNIVETFAQRFDEIQATKENHLYSDKKGTKVDVVVAKEVEKVGEVEIPHISKALNKVPQNEVSQNVNQTELLNNIYAMLASIQKNVEVLTATVTRLQENSKASVGKEGKPEKKPEKTVEKKTRTVDKTEKDRAKKPLKALPTEVIKDDLKGHEFEEEEEEMERTR